MCLDSDLADILGAPDTQLIALTGGGGKTSLALRLAQQACQQGLSVLVSTTTKMYHPKPDQFDAIAIHSDPDTLWQQLRPTPGKSAFVACSYDAKTNKVSGFAPPIFDQAKFEQKFDLILIEADGAKRLPIKAPSGHEPCIPLSSDTVFQLMGADALMAPLGPELVHRWPRFAEITSAQLGQTLSTAHLQRLLNHPEGGFKAAPKSARKIWVVNKVDEINGDLDTWAHSVIAGADLIDECWLTSTLTANFIVKRILKTRLNRM